MKILYFSAAMLCAALLSSQCKHPKYTAETLPDDRLAFGHGGGFTGVGTTFTLLENGQLFKSSSKAPETMELPGAKRKIAKKLFETAESLGLLQTEFMYPGNMYAFIEFQDDGQKRRVAWGDREHPVDPKIKDFYDQLMQLVREKKPEHY